MSARHHHSPEIDAYWGADYDEQAELARLDRIEQQLAADYQRCDTPNPHGRMVEYRDVAAMREDLRYLLQRVRANRERAA